MAGPMRRARRRGLQCPGGRIRILAVVACKSPGYLRQRPWAFVSARFDEAPTGKVFGVSSGFMVDSEMAAVRGCAALVRKSR